MVANFLAFSLTHTSKEVVFRKACPFCNDERKSYDYTLSKKGLSSFLKASLVSGDNNSYSPIDFLGKLNNFEDAEKVACNCTKLIKTPAHECLELALF